MVHLHAAQQHVQTRSSWGVVYKAKVGRTNQSTTNQNQQRQAKGMLSRIMVMGESGTRGRHVVHNAAKFNELGLGTVGGRQVINFPSQNCKNCPPKVMSSQLQSMSHAGMS